MSAEGDVLINVAAAPNFYITQAYESRLGETLTEYKVFTARYPIDTIKYAEGKRKGTVKRMGTIEERGWLSKSINDELDRLNRQSTGWKIHSISSVEAVGDIFAIILFEKP